VDWNGLEGQVLRFEKLATLIDPGRSFSLLDLGCGYGALYAFLAERFQDFDYLGVDVSAEMVEAARRRFAGAARATFAVGALPQAPADYAVASGIFNVKLDRPEAEWRAHVEATLDLLDQTGTRGFAFNCLTAYSDADRMRPDLYYPNPCELFDRCKRRYSRKVALLHDYDLYEFTLVVCK
jgi:SAM-dependent methyltransferase